MQLFSCCVKRLWFVFQTRQICSPFSFQECIKPINTDVQVKQSKIKLEGSSEVRGSKQLSFMRLTSFEEVLIELVLLELIRLRVVLHLATS